MKSISNMDKFTCVNRDLIQGPYLSLCLTETAYYEALKHCGVEVLPEMFISPQSDATMHTLRMGSEMFCIVAMRRFEDKDQLTVMGILVHEAVHVFQNYCQHIGEQDPSAEFEAYSIQKLSQELMASFLQQTEASNERGSEQ